MAATLLLIGTGTGIGKTHVAQRLLRTAGSLGARALGYKPVESGIVGDELDSDFARLEAASSFHVKPVLRYALPEAVSPHLAARNAGIRLDVAQILSEVSRLAALVDLLLVELPGGAFSPFTDDLLAVDVGRQLRPTRVLLVAPDRLGVLHDIGACTRACAAVGLPVDGILLNAPAEPDSSTGRNAPEIGRVTRVRLLATVARGEATASPAADEPLLPVVRDLLRPA